MNSIGIGKKQIRAFGPVDELLACVLLSVPVRRKGFAFESFNPFVISGKRTYNFPAPVR